MFKTLPLLLIALLLVGCIDKTDPDGLANTAPTAVLSSQSNTALAGGSLTFNATDSTDSDGNIVSYQWQVNNEDKGSNSSLFTYQFETAGTYIILLTVTDDKGKKNVTFQEIIVSVDADNNQPTAVINSDSNIKIAGESQSFVATFSNDSDGTIVLYQWEVDDVIIETNNMTLTYTFTEAKIYELKLSVTDYNGVIGFTSIDVPVDAYPQIVISQQITTINIGAMVIIDASNSTDNGIIQSYQWGINGQIESLDSKLEYVPISLNESQITLTITDNIGLESTQIFDINVIDPANDNVAPQPSLTGSLVGVENNIFTFDASASFDANSDGLTYQWFINDLVQLNQTTDTLQIMLGQGNYIIKVAVSDQEFTVNATHQIIINPIDLSNTEPVARLTGPTSIDVNQAVTFDASTSFDIDTNDVIAFKWYVDGLEVIGETNSTLVKSFINARDYIVSVKVTDLAGEHHKSQIDLSVNAVATNTDPVALLTGPATLEVNTLATFDAAQSYDLDLNDSFTFQWTIDDQVSVTHTSAQIEIKFTTAGNHVVEVKLTDLAGNTDSKIHMVTVNAAETIEPPVAVINLPSGVIAAKVLITLDASSSTDANNDIVLFEWFVDNLKIGEGEIFDYRFDTMGSKTVKLVVTDSQNQSSEISQDINVQAEVDVDPVAVISVDGKSITQDIYVIPGTTVIFSLADSFDPNSNSGLGDKFWLFNSGQAQRMDSYTIVFDQKGSFDLSLTVYDYSNAQNSTAITIHVADENVLPQIHLTGLSDVYDINKHLIVADASGSTDSDADDSTLFFEWKLNGQVISTQAVLMYNFTQQMDVTFELILTDIRGGVVSTTIDVTAQDVPETAPIAVINLMANTGYSPFKTQFDALNSTDANGNNSIVVYSWKVDGQQISTDANFEYTFVAVDDYELSLVVTDDTGLVSLAAIKTVTVETLDPTHPEVFTLLEDTGVMKIYKINNCGVSPEMIANSAAVLVDASGTTVSTTGWNHIPTAATRFANITAGDYSMSANMNAVATDCQSAPTNHNVFVKRYTDWHNQHANGQDYALNGVSFAEIQTFIVDIYIRSDRTEYLTTTQLSDIYGPDSSLQFPLTDAEVEDMDIGHLNI
ncbi:MAG: PKD domain-containing protein [Pseudomonadales bacterium]|nr:PKD domain-containing protein [Pseudomonadales bacterium]